MMERLRIKASGPKQPVGTLSGGNQQKVVLARWLATNPRLLFLDEPTRGLDVGAKTEILKLAVEFALAGGTILIVSSALEDLMRVSDRYLVISRGAIVAQLPGAATADELSSPSRTTPRARSSVCEYREIWPERERCTFPLRLSNRTCQRVRLLQRGDSVVF